MVVCIIKYYGFIQVMLKYLWMKTPACYNSSSLRITRWVWCSDGMCIDKGLVSQIEVTEEIVILIAAHTIKFYVSLFSMKRSV